MAAWRRGWLKEFPKFSRVSLLVGWSGGASPEEILKNQDCRRSHLKSFCNAIKVSNLPELCLFADVSRGESPHLFHALKCLRPGALAGNQTVAGSILNPGIFFRGDLVMKNILRPFSPFR